MIEGNALQDEMPELRPGCHGKATRYRGGPDLAAPVFAVTSGKGGVGKTNVVANLATALARKKKRILAIDADLGLANLDLILDV
ncbi:MAG TPA: AAA family ATPase, partial [Methylomirabilota bacterium]|nr:AAA family ATPase [Methylomirabilota bacterium]